MLDGLNTSRTRQPSSFRSPVPQRHSRRTIPGKISIALSQAEREAGRAHGGARRRRVSAPNQVRQRPTLLQEQGKPAIDGGEGERPCNVRSCALAVPPGSRIVGHDGAPAERQQRRPRPAGLPRPRPFASALDAAIFSAWPQPSPAKRCRPASAPAPLPQLPRRRRCLRRSKPSAPARRGTPGGGAAGL